MKLSVNCDLMLKCTWLDVHVFSRHLAHAQITVYVCHFTAFLFFTPFLSRTVHVLIMFWYYWNEDALTSKMKKISYFYLWFCFRSKKTCRWKQIQSKGWWIRVTGWRYFLLYWKEFYEVKRLAIVEFASLLSVFAFSWDLMWVITNFVSFSCALHF